MITNTDELLKELSKNEAKISDIWLLNAISSTGLDLTSGKLKGYENYCNLLNYFEEINVLTSQNIGIKGVCSTNAFFEILKSQSSLKLYKELIDNNILTTLTIVKMIKVQRGLIVEQNIIFSNCRLEVFKIFLNKVIFSIRYSSREEQYTEIVNGNKTGLFSVKN